MSNETNAVMKNMTNNAGTGKKMNYGVRFTTMTAMLSAIAFILMYLEIPLPMIMPDFIKFDFSDLPSIDRNIRIWPGQRCDYLSDQEFVTPDGFKEYVCRRTFQLHLRMCICDSGRIDLSF